MNELDMELLESAKEAQAPENPPGDGTFRAWPRSSKWRGVRDTFLKKNPACAACGGSKMLNVHHKKPFHLFPALELVESNLITLCELPSHSCHFAIGHNFDWTAWNPHVEEDAKLMALRVRSRRTGGDGMEEGT